MLQIFEFKQGGTNLTSQSPFYKINPNNMIGFVVTADPFPRATILLAAVWCPGGESVVQIFIYYKALFKA